MINCWNKLVLKSLLIWLKLLRQMQRQVLTISCRFCKENVCIFLRTGQDVFPLQLQQGLFSEAHHVPAETCPTERTAVSPFFNAPNFNTLLLQFSPSTYPSTMNRDFEPLSSHKGYVPLKERSLANRTFSLSSSASVRKLSLCYSKLIHLTLKPFHKRRFDIFLAILIKKILLDTNN